MRKVKRILRLFDKTETNNCPLFDKTETNNSQNFDKTETKRHKTGD